MKLFWLGPPQYSFQFFKVFRNFAKHEYDMIFVINLKVGGWLAYCEKVARWWSEISGLLRTGNVGPGEKSAKKPKRTLYTYSVFFSDSVEKDVYEFIYE